MITYNHKYRGEFEYEKFALNILSFHNIISNIKEIELEGSNGTVTTLKLMYDELNNFFNDMTGNKGFCEQTFLSILKGKEYLKWYQRWQVMSWTIF